MADKVTYSVDITPTVTKIEPIYSWQLGGDSITITGTGFGTVAGEASVKLWGIECTIDTIQDD